jgi:hypothetical protein
MTTFKIAQLVAARLLRWEYSWLCAEVLGVVIGLGLMLGTELDEEGGVMVFTVCAMSFFVRGRQHTRVTRAF